MKRAGKTAARMKPVWFPAGDRGLLLDLTGYGAQLGGLPPAEDRQALTRFARALSQRIKRLQTAGQLNGITDLVPGLASLLVHYDPLKISAVEVKKAVSIILEAPDDLAYTPARTWQLPVLYGAEAGPDLAEVASRCDISEVQVIDLHATTSLEVGIMGFLPGLAYMTGLHPSLHLPRRTEPRTHVAGGSVAIAMDQTVIYPLDSPGGWNLIGLMPIPLFDAARHEPVLLKAGELISFRPVKASEYKELQEACRDGQLPIAPSEAS